MKLWNTKSGPIKTRRSDPLPKSNNVPAPEISPLFFASYPAGQILASTWKILSLRWRLLSGKFAYRAKITFNCQSVGILVALFWIAWALSLREPSDVPDEKTSQELSVYIVLLSIRQFSFSITIFNLTVRISWFYHLMKLLTKYTQKSGNQPRNNI